MYKEVGHFVYYPSRPGPVTDIELVSVTGIGMKELPALRPQKGEGCSWQNFTPPAEGKSPASVV